MTASRLVVLLEGRRVGTIDRDVRGRLSLTYDDVWRNRTSATPLSVSLPLAADAHDDVTSAYLWGLLPDNEQCSNGGVESFMSRRATPTAC